MTGEAILGAIVMAVCGFGCGALFYGIGIWAQKRKTPMHFWAGTQIETNTISDIPAYNRANARLWKLYSVPYLLSGVTGVMNLWSESFSVVCLILVGLAGTVGIWWLIRSYKEIWNQYARKG